jgi:hypothetical protein
VATGGTDESDVTIDAALLLREATEVEPHRDTDERARVEAREQYSTELVGVAANQPEADCLAAGSRRLRYVELTSCSAHCNLIA